MDSNLGDAMASMPQYRNILENRRGEDNKMSRRVWKAVEAKTGKIRLGKTKEGGSQRRSRVKAGGMREEEVKRKEDGESKKSSRKMGDLG